MINDTKKKNKIQVKSIPPKCWEYETAKITYEGAKYVTVVQQERKTLNHVKKLSKTHYQVISTGEIKEYQPMTAAEKRVVRRASLSKTFRELSGLIRTNFVDEGEQGWESQAFVTMTYRDNVTDEKRVYKDFELFFKRLEYKYKGKYQLEYIAVAEPQGRGAWHFHVMLKTINGEKLWVNYDVLQKLWPHGGVRVERLKARDIGAYYAAYFTNLLPGTANFGDEDFVESGQDLYAEELKRIAELQRVPGQRKRIVKGARLEMYPPYMKLYRASRGVDRPGKTKDYLYSVTEDSNYKKVYEKSYEISKTDESGETSVLNRIYRGTYKRLEKNENG